MISLEFDYFPVNSINIIDMRRILKAAAKRMIYLGLSCYAPLRSHHYYLHISNRGSGVLPTIYQDHMSKLSFLFLTLFPKINFILPLTGTMSKRAVHIVATISPREGKVDRVSTSLSVIFDLHLETSFFTIRSMNRDMSSYSVFLGHRTLNRHGEIRQRKRA